MLLACLPACLLACRLAFLACWLVCFLDRDGKILRFSVASSNLARVASGKPVHRQLLLYAGYEHCGQVTLRVKQRNKFTPANPIQVELPKIQPQYGVGPALRDPKGLVSFWRI